MPEYSPQPGDRVSIEGTVVETGHDLVIIDCGDGLGCVPASAARRVTQLTYIEPGPLADPGTDQDEVAKTRALDAAQNLHYHQHAGSEFSSCTMTECAAALERNL